MSIDGWVPTEGYEQAREKEQYIKQQILDAADTEEERKQIEEEWLFRDHEEID